MTDVNFLGSVWSLGEKWAPAVEARGRDPRLFDDRVQSDRVAGTPRPLLVARPGDSDDLAPRYERYLAAGAPAVIRVCPGPRRHGYPLLDWTLPPVPEFCDRRGAAIAIDMDMALQDVPWRDLVDLARRYLGVPIIVHEVELDPHVVHRVLDVVPNLLFDLWPTSTADVGAVTRLIEHGGAHRFLIGSGTRQGPLMTAGLPTHEIEAAAALVAQGAWRDRYL